MGTGSNDQSFQQACLCNLQTMSARFKNIPLTDALQDVIDGRGYREYILKFGDRKPAGGRCDFGQTISTHLHKAARHGHALSSAIRYHQLRQLCKDKGIAAPSMSAYQDKNRPKRSRVKVCLSYVYRGKICKFEKTGRARGQTERWLLKSVQKKMRKLQPNKKEVNCESSSSKYFSCIHCMQSCPN